MRAILCVAALATSTIVARAAPGDANRPIRVVLVADASAATAGMVRRALSSRRIDVVELARSEAGTTIAEGKLAEARTALARATDQFYANRMVEARAELARVETALGASIDEASRPLWIELALWRAGVALASEDDAGAGAAARAALLLDPELAVPMERFWPSLAQLVERERASLRRIRLRVRDAPSDARLLLDGRPLARSVVADGIEVVAGRHRLEIAAPDHHPSREALELTTDVELSRPLDRIVSAAVVGQVRQALDRSDPRALAVLGNQIFGARSATGFLTTAPAAFVTVTGERGRGAVVARGSISRSPDLAIEELAAWLRRELESPTTIEARWAWSASARLGIFVSDTTFSWRTSRVTIDGSGGGATLGLDVFRRPWRIATAIQIGREVEGTASAVDVTPAPGTARAGTIAAIDVSAGADVELLAGRLRLQPHVQLEARTNRPGGAATAPGHDLTDAYSNVGIGIGLTVGVRPWPWLVVRGTIAIEPITAYIERPRAAGNANPPDVARVDFAAAITLSHRLTAELGLDYRQASIQYVGGTNLALSPTPVDVSEREETALLWLGVRYAR